MNFTRTVFVFFLSSAGILHNIDGFTPNAKRTIYEPDYTNMKYANTVVDISPHVNANPVNTFPLAQGQAPSNSPFDEFKQTIIDAVYEKKSDRESEEKLKAAIENQKQLLSDARPSPRSKKTRVTAEDFVSKFDVLPRSEVNPMNCAGMMPMGMPTFGLERDQYLACGMHMMGYNTHMNGNGMNTGSMNMNWGYYENMGSGSSQYAASSYNIYGNTREPCDVHPSYGRNAPQNMMGYNSPSYSSQGGYFGQSYHGGSHGMHGAIGGQYGYSQGMTASHGYHDNSRGFYGADGPSSAYHRTPLPQSVLGENGMGSSTRSYKY